jgi:transcriptional regulator
VAFGETAPAAVHVPFIFTPSEGGGSIELHVARANPIHELIAANPRVLLVCTGPDAYKSPDWYESPNQVPSRNHIAVHATGQARIMDQSWLPAHLDRLSGQFEGWLPKKPWTSAGLDPQRLAAMFNAIVGIIIGVESLESSWKLGQHKGRDDHDGAVAGLRATDDATSAAVANLMDDARGIRRV